jgi:hypothetical protein
MNRKGRLGPEDKRLGMSAKGSVRLSSLQRYRVSQKDSRKCSFNHLEQIPVRSELRVID